MRRSCGATLTGKPVPGRSRGRSEPIRPPGRRPGPRSLACRRVHRRDSPSSRRRGQSTRILVRAPRPFVGVSCPFGRVSRPLVRVTFSFGRVLRPLVHVSFLVGRASRTLVRVTFLFVRVTFLLGRVSRPLVRDSFLFDREAGPGRETRFVVGRVISPAAFGLEGNGSGSRSPHLINRSWRPLVPHGECRLVGSCPTSGTRRPRPGSRSGVLWSAPPRACFPDGPRLLADGARLPWATRGGKR
jgi:hypothetical protein